MCAYSFILLDISTNLISSPLLTCHNGLVCGCSMSDGVVPVCQSTKDCHCDAPLFIAAFPEHTRYIFTVAERFCNQAFRFGFSSSSLLIYFVIFRIREKVFRKRCRVSWRRRRLYFVAIEAQRNTLVFSIQSSLNYRLFRICFGSKCRYSFRLLWICYTSSSMI